jgi:hypothetical protein
MLNMITQRCLDTAWDEFLATDHKGHYLEAILDRFEERSRDFMAVVDKLPRTGIRSFAYLYRLVELSYDGQPPVVRRNVVEELRERVSEADFMGEVLYKIANAQPFLAKHPAFMDSPPLMLLAYEALDRASEDMPLTNSPGRGRV